MLLVRDPTGKIHKITGEDICGRNGISMAIPELFGDSYQAAVTAIAAREQR